MHLASIAAIAASTASLPLASAASLLSRQSASTAPIAVAPAGTFQGAYTSTYNISYYKKIPFAEPPLGVNRFRAPQPLAPLTNGTYDSNQPYDMCVQRTVNGSEDCLYFGLYSRPWTTGQPLRAVLVNFYGGAFIEGGGSFNIPPAAFPTLNVSASNDYIVVEPNYRVNAFGYLSGQEVAADPDSDANVGLRDQQMVLQWVNQNIFAFGGDKDNVVIWGQSAGAGSVVGLSIANPSYQAGLINRALASSPFWPHSYRYDSPETQSIYDQFAALAGCSGNNSLACLKAADVQTLRNAALVIDSSHTYNISSYTWAPVIDDDFLTLPLSQAGDNIRANLPGGAWGMYNTHEGENFIPPGLANASSNMSAPLDAGTYFNSTEASFEEWASGFLPDLTGSQFAELLTAQYPASGFSESITAYNTTYTRAGLIYRDVILACPAYWLASSFVGANTSATGYLGEYTIPPATHGSDTIYWNQVNAVQTTDPTTYQGYAGAFASWFATGDPNAHKLTDASQSRVPSLATGDEWTVAQDDFGTAALTQLSGRCAFWKSVAGNVPV